MRPWEWPAWLPLKWRWRWRSVYLRVVDIWAHGWGREEWVFWSVPKVGRFADFEAFDEAMAKAIRKAILGQGEIEKAGPARSPQVVASAARLHRLWRHLHR